MSIRIAAIGECMIELSAQGRDLWRQGFAGDTNNTATYLARLLSAQNAQVAYVTALGDDSFSTAMVEAWQNEQIDTQYVQHLKGLLPGLYAIQTDDRGERQFYYWRSQAAARRMLDDPAPVQAAIADASCVYLSGITLAILEPDARRRLIDLLSHAKTLVFDPNYRPRLWPDRDEAQSVLSEVMSLSTIAMPTHDDEAELFGDANPQVTIERIAGLGVEEIVTKCGPDPCLIRHNNEICEVAAKPVDRAIDTTGAGDSFNAAYLAARLCNLEPTKAAKIGHELAATVIAHQGAIIKPHEMPDFSTQLRAQA